MNLTRRTFAKGVLAVTSAAALYGCGKYSQGQYAFDFDKKAEKSDIYSSSYCSVNCTPRCRLIGRVKDGRIVGVTPGELPGRPGYGTACLRGQSLPWKLQSHDHRVLHPLYRRNRDKFGTMEGFEQISWEEAFKILAQKVKENVSNPTKIRFFQMTGNLGTLQNGAAGRFANTIGASVFQYGNEAIMSDHGGSRGMEMVYGVTRGHHDHREYKDSYMAIFWGRNVADTHTSEMQYLLDAKEAGCKIITVDPRLSSTGAVADEWIQIRPYTDTALILAMLHEMIINTVDENGILKPKEERWLDLDYIDTMV
jgi:molybdopterin-containing oxidoreductase family molybdopterin binding subunit